ncbi:MAG: dihydrolipoyl dehydrogenase [Candidatus Peregrinibacteria bacterium]|nr:dihydrolipoyl dehydrogenase [Candidatus Peregrinibacteria bacterium]
MENLSFDGVIIGSGPGGSGAALALAARGAKVALIESALIGGECLHWGCIPSKIYLHSAHLYQSILKSGDACGVVTGGVTFDFAKLVERRKKLIPMLHRGLENSLKTAGVQIIMGKGRLVGPNSVKVTMADGSEQMIETKNIILATGSNARVPEGVKIGGRILTNREIFTLEQQPKSILITGGGTVGCEMASFFSNIGTSVILVEMGERLLGREDGEISAEFLKLVTRGDVKVHLKTSVVSMEDTGSGVKVVMEHEGGVREEVIVEYALAAAGRTLNTDVCDYEICGVKVENGKIVTNGFMQTSAANIYAIGDLAGKAMLAYTAEREGEIAADHILGASAGETLHEMNYRVFPSVIFTLPEIASVGLTEEAARAAGKNIIVKKAPFAANSKALAMGERDGFAKVIVESGTGIILGVHIIGPDATTMIDKATLALDLNITASQMFTSIVGHPVTSETLKAALRMALADMSKA